MIRAVIFDLDGTLIHSLPGLTTSLNRVLSSYGFPNHSESKVRGFIGHGITDLISKATPAGTPPDKLSQIVQAMSDDYAASWKTGSAPYPKVNETLLELSKQHIALAVFSNKPDIFCREMTDYLLPDIHFTEVLGQRAETPVKPDPTGALQIAKTLEVPTQEIAFLGDSTIDISTARNAGMLSIGASWGYHDLPALKAESPDHLIHSIAELPAILKSNI